MKRNHRFEITLGDTEFAFLQKAAKITHVDQLRTWARSVILREAEAIVRRQEKEEKCDT